MPDDATTVQTIVAKIVGKTTTTPSDTNTSITEQMKAQGQNQRKFMVEYMLKYGKIR
jgi:hypothetical protein